MIEQIPVTQYIRPNGRKILLKITRPPDVLEKADYCINKGAVFTVEILTTQQLSTACEYNDNDIVIDIAKNVLGKANESLDKVVQQAFELIRKEQDDE